MWLSIQPRFAAACANPSSEATAVVNESGELWKPWIEHMIKALATVVFTNSWVIGSAGTLDG